MKYQLENCFINIRNNTEYLDAIQKSLSGKNKVTFFYLNSYSFYLVNKNEEFRSAFNKADFIIADGFSIVWLIKKLYGIKIEKVVFTYSFFEDMHKIFLKGKTKIFILGSQDETIEKSFGILKNDFNINITGYSYGFFDQRNDSAKIIKKINESNAEILIVGMGMPQSEIWIQENLERLNPKIIFSVGGFFDFLAQDKKMAPKWMYNSGLEWLHRLIQEPSRLFKRYLTANSYLILYLIKNELKKWT